MTKPCFLLRSLTFGMLLFLISSSFLSSAEKPSLLINQDEFRDRVYACWLGKNIGGTLGMPFEGKKDPQNISFYTNLKPGEPAPNDDLDLQILWLKAMEDHGGRVDARILGEYWLKFVPVDWNEYGVGKKNMRIGLLPPLSGEYNNAQWKHSNGAWIRSEIWACLAPGCPALAARMAREDACVDHGAAEGTIAEIFTAALESAAFVESDRDKLLQIGLSMIPQDSQVAAAIRAAIDAKKAGKNWKDARLEVIRASEKTGWFQAPRNVAYTMLGWLYGEGDFGKSLCTAVNCGDDTDCTGATLGSIFGIIHGTRGIPQKWSEPVGTKIKTVAITGFEHPNDISELTDHTVAMAKKYLEMNDAPVRIVAGPTDRSKAGRLVLSDPAGVKPLWSMSPYQIVWNEPGIQIILDYLSDPVIASGSTRPLRVSIRNLDRQAHAYEVKVKDLPGDWEMHGLPVAPAKIAGQALATLEIQLNAKEVQSSPNRMLLEVSGGSRTVTLPLTLIGRADQKARE